MKLKRSSRNFFKVTFYMIKMLHWGQSKSHEVSSNFKGDGCRWKKLVGIARTCSSNKSVNLQPVPPSYVDIHHGMSSFDWTEDLYNGGGDEMIDVKADEFISKFYQQIRLQNIIYTHAF
ncbi:hypothetical protein ACFE04_019343 [Oxalis oulophora]